MKMTLGKKLYGGFGMVLLLTVAMMVFNYFEIARINTTYQDLMDKNATVTNLVKDLNISIKEEQSRVDAFLLFGSKSSLTQYQAANQQFEKTVRSLQKVFTVKDADHWQVLQGLDMLQQEYTILADQMIDAKKKSDTEGYMTIGTQKVDPVINKFKSTADKLVAEQQNLLNTTYKDTEEQVSRIKLIVIVITAIALIAGAAISFVITRLISKPVRELSAAAEKIAEGDLSQTEIEVKSKDEIGDLANSFRHMSVNLRELIEQVASHAEQVAASSEELMAGADQTGKATEQVASIAEEVAVGTDQQVHSIKESEDSIHRMSSEAEHIAISAKTVSDRAIEASDMTVAGNEASQTAMDRMNEIQATVSEIAESVKGLGQRSEAIGEIIDVIAGIAKQTNLLALNASIEAARAGEAGRGFSVVANEVKKLAEQSASSGREITELVKTIQEDTRKTIDAVEEGTHVVEAGLESMKVAGSSFENIQLSIQDVSSQIQSVSAASKQLSVGTQQIVAAFAAISKITDTNALGTQSVLAATEEQSATMQEIGASSKHLAAMSEKLLNMVNKFKL